jgi:hypothetical protein
MIMPDPAQTPHPDAPANWAAVHPKISAVAIAGLATTILLPLLKRWGVDLAGQEANLAALLAVVAGYLMPSGDN